MSWQKEIRMKIGYRLIGNLVSNLVNRSRFGFLENKIPKEFYGREISDLGCGDGFITLKIKKLFKAKSIVGYELNDFLIKRAQKRGLLIYKLNLEESLPSGEMVSGCGVLHHLRDKEKVIREINSKFKLAFFVEPIKTFWAFLDGGEPLLEEEWKKLFAKNLGRCQLLRYKDELFIFWKKEEPAVKILPSVF